MLKRGWSLASLLILMMGCTSPYITTVPVEERNGSVSIQPTTVPEVWSDRDKPAATTLPAEADPDSKWDKRPSRQSEIAPYSESQSKPLSPIAQRLVNEAEIYRTAGQYASAAAALERAQRISPRAPLIYLSLATLRLQQGNFTLAEQLALKGRNLAVGNRELQARFDRLIEQARKEES
jgi:tetratricopeptide (TPR) repeat protein